MKLLALNTQINMSSLGASLTQKKIKAVYMY